MKRIVLDGDRIEGLASFHGEVRRRLCPGFDGYGRNLDAFDDVLRGGFGVFDEGEPIVLEWRNAARSRRTLGHAALAAHLRTTAARADASHHARLAVEVALADRGEGPTLFDRIVGIIRRHLPITLVLR